MISRALFWPAPAVDVMSNESDMRATYHADHDCQQKSDNNLKINFNFMLAKLSNPLKQGISRNSVS
jgi:hypothetical protein